jgi:hypothetical protein
MSETPQCACLKSCVWVPHGKFYDKFMITHIGHLPFVFYTKSKLSWTLSGISVIAHRAKNTSVDVIMYTVIFIVICWVLQLHGKSFCGEICYACSTVLYVGFYWQDKWVCIKENKLEADKLCV